MINLAKRIALKSDHKSHKHATLLLKGGSLISYGYNKNHRHAEVSAIFKAHSNLPHGSVSPKVKNSYAINLMITRRGIIGKSRPCKTCWKFLRDCGVKKVTYFDGLDWVTERIL